MLARSATGPANTSPRCSWGDSTKTTTGWTKPFWRTGAPLPQVRYEGVTDFDQYRADPTQPLQVDFFVPDDMPPPKGVSLTKLSP